MAPPINRVSTGPIDIGQLPDFETGKEYSQALNGPLDTQSESSSRNQPLRTGYRPDNFAAGNPHASEGHPGMTHDAPHWQTSDRDSYGLMVTGERNWGNEVVSTITRHAKDIDEAAAKFGVDRNLISATIYEEQTHTMPGETTAEYYGVAGNTVGFGQMTVGNHGYTRDELLNPRENIFAIAEHYSKIDPSLSIEEMAAAYNGTGPKAEMYGRRVQNFYNEFVTNPMQLPTVVGPHMPAFKPEVFGPPIGPKPMEALNPDFFAAPPRDISLPTLNFGGGPVELNTPAAEPSFLDRVKNVASDVWSGIKDFANGAWRGFQQGASWLGDKIQQNAQFDRPSILESRDADMGIESYSAQEAWDGVKDAFGFGDKSNQDDGESSAESRSDRETHDPTSNDDYSDRMSDKA